MSASLTARTTDNSSSARSWGSSSWSAISTTFRFKVYSLVLMRAHRRLPWPGGTVALATILLSTAGASQASAATQVRFLHALPGGPTADLTVKGGRGPAATLSGIGFGKASEAEPGPSGSVTVTLIAGGKEVATAKEFLADGASYTIVAEKGSGSKPVFRLYRAGKAGPGQGPGARGARRPRARPRDHEPERPATGARSATARTPATSPPTPAPTTSRHRSPARSPR